jgi:hypothetical protein
MTDKQISEILEEEGYSFTDNLEESVFILKNGNLVDGGFFGGDTRTIEHREIAESVVLDKDRYDKDFWSVLHQRTSMIMVVPETRELLIMEKQKLSNEQKAIINSNPDYTVKEYCKNKDETKKTKSISKYDDFDIER